MTDTPRSLDKLSMPQTPHPRQQLQTLARSGRLGEAQVLGAQLCAAYPRDADLWFLLASVHARCGAFEDVVACCGNAVKLQPGNASMHYNLGVALQMLRRLSEAEQSFRTALELAPSLTQAGNNLGLVLLEMGRAEEAVQVYQQQIAEGGALSAAQRAAIYASLGHAQLRLGRFKAVELSCLSALQLDPCCAHAHNNLGLALKEQGRIEEAVAEHRRTIELHPTNTEAHSNLLLELNYLSNTDADNTAVEHRRWGQQHAVPLHETTTHDNVPDSERRLRVGYVSSDFRAHSVAFFIEPLLAAHDRNRVEVYAYANVAIPDAMTEHLRELTDQWRGVRQLDDARLAALIREDGIDVLVDLSGHTSGNRLLAFASQPAPVQVTWLGYPNTTGMTMIDYRLTDAWADPPGVGDDRHTETLIRLPRGFLCYQPLADCPDVGVLPARAAGHITFGCFNNSAKINAEVLNLWCRILHDLPDARLLLKSKQLCDDALRNRYHEEFARHGIDPRRIEMLGRVASTREHLAIYNRVDIALDVFPYNGTTTTCEALWLGVPVITLAGDTHAGRVGVSLLSSVGLADLVAGTPSAYQALAVNLARDLGRCAALRAGLRERMRVAPLLDAAGFARDVEAAYRHMWSTWCAQHR